MGHALMPCHEPTSTVPRICVALFFIDFILLLGASLPDPDRLLLRDHVPSARTTPPFVFLPRRARARYLLSSWPTAAQPCLRSFGPCSLSSVMSFHPFPRLTIVSVRLVHASNTKSSS